MTLAIHDNLAQVATVQCQNKQEGLDCIFYANFMAKSNLFAFCHPSLEVFLVLHGESLSERGGLGQRPACEGGDGCLGYAGPDSDKWYETSQGRDPQRHRARTWVLGTLLLCGAVSQFSDPSRADLQMTSIVWTLNFPSPF